VDDPLGALHHLANIISDEPMLVPWDADVFRRDIDFPLYLHNQDVLEFMLGTKELNIIVIQL